MTLPKSLPVAPALVLRHGDREIRLAAGSYVIGRHLSCDVVLESPLVSRRHARVTVSRLGVTLADLGSHNGVALNEERIGGAVSLYTGDRVLLGDQELSVEVEGPGRHGSGELEKVLARDAARPRHAAEDVLTSPPLAVAALPSPAAVDFFALTESLVARAVAEGRFHDAGELLAPQFDRVLGDSIAGVEVSRASRDRTLHYAALLAGGTRDRRFLDLALDVMAASALVPAEDLADELEEAAFAVGDVDDRRLATWVSRVGEAEDPLDRIRVTILARVLERAARRAC